jgi:AmiR/NasT family two-component response regulator
MATDASIRVVLADDNLIVREGVRALLLVSGDIDVVGVAGDYDELVARADALTPRSWSPTSACRRTSPTRGSGRRG